MFVEEPFAGWESEFWQMPVRNVVPKPLQRPHPPLWVACSRRETIQFAARKGIGALSFSFVEPEDAGRWVEDYYSILDSEECVPAGFAVNPNVAVVLPMMLHADEAEAIERGIDGAHFFGYSLAHYYGMGHHRPGRTVIWDEFNENRESRGFARSLVSADAAPLAVKIMQHGLGSLRGAIGTPDQVLDLCRRYEAAGVDQVDLRAPGRAQSPRAHLRVARAVRPSRASALRRSARGARKAEGRAPCWGRGAGAGPALAAPRGAVRLSDRRAGRAGTGGSVPRRRRTTRATAHERPGGAGEARARQERPPARASLRRRPRPAPDLPGHGPPVRAQVRLRLRGRHRVRAHPPCQSTRAAGLRRMDGATVEQTGAPACCPE